MTFTGEGVNLVEAGTAPEGLFRGVLEGVRFAFNVLRDTDARRRVFEMRRVFRRHRGLIAAVAVTAVRV